MGSREEPIWTIIMKEIAWRHLHSRCRLIHINLFPKRSIVRPQGVERWIHLQKGGKTNHQVAKQRGIIKNKCMRGLLLRSTRTLCNKNLVNCLQSKELNNTKAKRGVSAPPPRLIWCNKTLRGRLTGSIRLQMMAVIWECKRRWRLIPGKHSCSAFRSKWRSAMLSPGWT